MEICFTFCKLETSETGMVYTLTHSGSHYWKSADIITVGLIQQQPLEMLKNYCREVAVVIFTKP